MGLGKRNPTHQAIYLHLLHSRISGPAFAFAFPRRAGGGAGRSGSRACAFLAGRHLFSQTGKKRNVSDRKRKYGLYVTSRTVQGAELGGKAGAELRPASPFQPRLLRGENSLRMCVLPLRLLSRKGFETKLDFLEYFQPYV